MIAYVIPALNPPLSLQPLVHALASKADAMVVLVDDGSVEAAAFDGLAELPSVVLLRHAVNQGKGEALKTAFRHLTEHTSVRTAITLDADGQHRLEDVERVASAARARPDALVLGVRTFSGNVPFKSVVGNRLTNSILRLFHGLSLQDSQTGLRALPIDLARRCLTIRAGRYGFELEMLLVAKAHGITLHQVPIETVYFDNNAASHFRPVRDSLGVYLVFLRFSAASLSSFLLDIGLFALFHAFSGSVFTSTYAARLSSGTFNFLANRHMVFRAGNAAPIWQHLLGYAALAVCIATASAGAVSFLSGTFQASPTLVKLLVDPSLFLISFLTQRIFIFRRKS